MLINTPKSTELCLMKYLGVTPQESQNIFNVSDHATWGMSMFAERSKSQKRIYYRRATLADSLLTSGSLAHPRVPRPINTVAAGWNGMAF